MASRCPRSQMNASGHFASTSSKRNRHQLFHSALAHIHPTTKRLTTLQFAGAEDVKTVSSKEYKNITERFFLSVTIRARTDWCCAPASPQSKSLKTFRASDASFCSINIRYVTLTRLRIIQTGARTLRIYAVWEIHPVMALRVNEYSRSTTTTIHHRNGWPDGN